MTPANSTRMLPIERVNQRARLRRILLINAVINRNQNITQVKVETAESVLKRMELELATADPGQIEAAIATELQLSRQDVRQLVRYEIIE